MLEDPAPFVIDCIIVWLLKHGHMNIHILSVGLNPKWKVLFIFSIILPATGQWINIYIYIPCGPSKAVKKTSPVSLFR